MRAEPHTCGAGRVGVIDRVIVDVILCV